MTNILHIINPLYTASGFVVGALVGFTGVGGGSLMTPLLVLLFGIHPATAVGTDLLYAGLTKISGSDRSRVQWRDRLEGHAQACPRKRARRRTHALGGLLISAWTSKGASVAITTTLGFALILTAVTLLFRRRLLKAVAGSSISGTTRKSLG